MRAKQTRHSTNGSSSRSNKVISTQANIKPKIIIKQAREVLTVEARGIMSLAERIDDNFVKMVDIIAKSKGRLIVGGIGKSGIVGRKIVATLNSTGTRALSLHPVEAMHGDLGVVGRNDIFLALSNSGETDEINMLIPAIRKIGCKVIAFTGNTNSTLAKHSDIVIDVGVEKEACPLGLAPTASTTAVLAMGDALAVVLINKKKFKSSDFKKIHPGGTLGQRLLSKVKDLMLTGKSVPWVFEGVKMGDAIKKIDQLKLGAVLILNTEKRLVGIITDGDIRHLISKNNSIVNLPVEDVMTREPLAVNAGSPVYDALDIMEQHQITVLPVIDLKNKIQGILHLHDILGKGAFKFNGT